MQETTSIQIKYKLPKNYVVLAYDEKMPRRFWRIAIVTRVLRRRDSEKKVRIKKANAILKRPVNKIFPTEYKANQTGKATDNDM